MLKKGLGEQDSTNLRAAYTALVSMRVRKCVRAILLAGGSQVLLMEMDFPWNDGPIWILPGGGIEKGESAAQALTRELREETGYDLNQTLAPIGHGKEPYPEAGITLIHTYYLIDVNRFEPQPENLEAREAEWLRRFRWWPLDELGASNTIVLPSNLGDGIDTLLNTPDDQLYHFG